MSKAPWVDEEKCTGCGLCIANIPEVFRLADNGKAECYNPDGASEREIQEAAVDVCPALCILWAATADE